jgi:hypothetical protein
MSTKTGKYVCNSCGENEPFLPFYRIWFGHFIKTLCEPCYEIFKSNPTNRQIRKIMNEPEQLDLWGNLLI